MHVSCSRRAGASSSSWGQGAEEWLKGASAKRIPKAWPTRPRALPCPAQRAGSEVTQVLQQQVGAGGGRETHSHPASLGQPPTPGDPLALNGSPLFTHPEAGSVCPSPPSGTGAADSWGALNPRPSQVKGQKQAIDLSVRGSWISCWGSSPAPPREPAEGQGRGLPGADTGAPLRLPALTSGRSTWAASRAWAALSGSDRFCVRKRRSSRGSLATESREKEDTGQTEGQG